MTSYQRTNCDYWQSEYDTRYPDTTLVRLYHHILKYELPTTRILKALDYGCSTGTNVFFLNDMGIDAYGVDINKIAIRKARERASALGLATHFLPVTARSSTTDVFHGGAFDLIVSWHTLYYLSDGDLALRLKSLYEQLKDGGLFVATLLATMTASYRQTEPAENGLRKMIINEPGRGLHEKEHFLKFARDPTEVENTFRMFQPLHIGYVDECVSMARRENMFHYTFVGKKTHVTAAP